ncbi:MAG: hypothetical protein MR842_05400 [Clostridiales bacterium]|nr:hypothetical protein [Clostridiales bacterium]MDO4350456.1 hypothetical protein [Eubacteriales bacterium]MDY4007326.1 hypothetical protein [Candidatus Limiplasma sp.]
MGYETEFEQRYAQALGGLALPERAARAYEATDCLRQDKEKALWLARSRQDGSRCVIKAAYGGQRRFLQAEWDCLTELWNAGTRCIPKPLQFAQEGECAWLARAWCEGETLAALVRRQGFLDERRVTLLGAALCDALSALHAHGFVCRDVKPENVVIAPDETAVLIDCDAARRYAPGKAHDTFFVASRETAAPEQYGFSQSDERTDVYGAGRTLMYMACGCYHARQLNRLRLSRAFKRVLLRAASAQPERRYPSAAALKAALERCRRFRRLPLAAGAALAVGIVVLGVACLRPSPLGEAVPSFLQDTAEGGRLAEIFQLNYNEAFREENYQGMVDELLSCYAQRDKDKLAQACEALVAALYADPGLLAGEKVDYAQLDPLPGDFFDVTPSQSISYGLWYGDELLRRSLGAYRDYAGHFLRCMDDDLHKAALGKKTSSIYTYLELPMERRDEVLDYTLSDIVSLLGRAIASAG